MKNGLTNSAAQLYKVQSVYILKSFPLQKKLKKNTRRKVNLTALSHDAVGLFVPSDQ